MTTTNQQETKTGTGAPAPFPIDQEHDVRTALWAQALIREHQAKKAAREGRRA